MQTEPEINPKAQVIVAQVFISCIMAFLMSFTMSIVIAGNFHAGWVHDLLMRWILAWPIAFVFSLIVGPIAFKLSRRVNLAILKVRRRAA